MRLVLDVNHARVPLGRSAVLIVRPAQMLVTLSAAWAR